MLKTILRNLLTNAIKFSYKNGNIKISIKKEDNFAKISMIDNGVGISAENQSKLWNFSKPFTTPSTENEKGTGLGLILCKEFVEMHKGKMIC